MTLAQAQAFLQQVAAHSRRWGKHGTTRDFSQQDLMTAIVTVDDAGGFTGDAATLKADLTLARRQLGAANARLAKYEQKKGDTNEA